MALVVLGLVYWHGLAALPVPPEPNLADNQTETQAPILPPALQNLAWLLGDERIDAGTPLNPPNVVLTGVAASPQNGGAAVMSVDGQTAKPYFIGDLLTKGWQLQAVTADGVLLARGSSTHHVYMTKTQP